MIKIILHGGNSKKSFYKNSDFVLEMFAGGHVNNILIVTYARNLESYEEIFVSAKNRFIDSFFELSKIKFELSSNNQGIFLEQIRNSDLIFFSGGDEEFIKERIKNIIPEVLLALNSKVVVGVSAGANIFSSNYYSNDRDQVEEGLGIVKIKTICHYSEDKEEMLKKIININNFPTVTIKEEEYVVFYV